jgi:hypothetical protein
MKNQAKLSAVVVSAALLAGCASGGGGGGGSSGGRIDTPEETILCMVLGIFCLFMGDAAAPAAKSGSTSTGTSGGTASAQAATASAPIRSFTTWSELPRETEVQTVSLTTILEYRSNGPINATSVSTEPFALSNEYPQYDVQGKLVRYGPFYPSSGATATTLAALGQPGIDVRQQGTSTSVVGAQVGVNPNPYVLGWEYQSFGVWNNSAATSGFIRASTFGASTPGSAVPTSGTAIFTGKAAGFYISPEGQSAMAAAELSVNANFNTRSLALSSSGTVITRDAKTATAAPNLDLKGTLTYAPGINSFKGSLVNSSGTMSGSSQGKFYGPAAQELGGAFTVKSPSTVEAFTGAYGAKR